MNPLDRYRREQARVRRLFDPFTHVHCAACPTPCCRKPARIRPVDLILVEELTGAPLPAAAADPFRDGAAALLDLPEEDPGASADPCDFLTPHGCSFPADLRPFGCAAFICEPMRRTLSAEELAEVETAVARLTEAYERLMAALHRDR
jgi:hypothetical protein